MDSSTGEIISEPDVVSRGFVYVRESENLMDDIKKVIYEEIRKCEENHITDWSTIKSNLKDTLRDYILKNKEKSYDFTNYNRGLIKHNSTKYFTAWYYLFVTNN